MEAADDEQLWQEAISAGRRRGGARRALRRLLLAALLISVGAAAALFITQTSIEDAVDSVNTFWDDVRGAFLGEGGGQFPGQSDNNQGGESPGGGSGLPVSATEPPTPTSTPTSVPTPTAVPASPWENFRITNATVGKEVLDRLSDDERACLGSANGEDFLNDYQDYPLGARVGANPRVRNVSDLPQLAGCLSEESAAHFNRAIEIFHDPSLAPSPTPTVAPTLTPSPAATSASAGIATPRPTTTIAVEAATPVARIDRLRQLALDLINEDRADHGMPPVALGTNVAAQLHAQDMLTNDYQGHWWADGHKPYMVYTQTGGTSYAAENAASFGWKNDEWRQAGCNSALVRCSVPTPEKAVRDLQWLMMYDDAHADWGHRDNILGETHRAVNVGIAWNNRRVTFVQHFEGGAVTADAPPSLDQNSVLSLSVTKNEGGVRIGGLVSVYFDPTPRPVSRELNDSLDSYCVGGGATTRCGDSVVRILDPPQPGRFYTDLDDNEVVATTWTETTTSFSFSADVGSLMEKPGVYTVILWRDDGGATFSGSLVQLSVFVE